MLAIHFQFFIKRTYLYVQLYEFIGIKRRTQAYLFP